MRVILILDYKNGMLFNHRRQSKDLAISKKIEKLLSGGKLFMNPYSKELFQNTDIRLVVDDDFLHKAGKEDYCFVEDKGLLDVKNDIDEFVIFRWNRQYPSDLSLDVLPEESGMTCIYSEEFAGRSHDRITMERWDKEI